MAIQLNHTIVHAKDKHESARFLVEILGLPAAASFGPFLVVQVANDVSLDFAGADHGPVHPQHYAFLVGEAEFDEIFGRSRNAPCPTRLTRPTAGPARSTTTTGAAASIGTTRKGTLWRSSPGPTAAGADQPDPSGPDAVATLRRNGRRCRELVRHAPVAFSSAASSSSR